MPTNEPDQTATAPQGHVASTDELERISFVEHRDRTAEDLEAVIAQLQKLAASVRQGDTDAFERWWFEGGTEKGDATVFQIREQLMLRYSWREERLAL